MSSKRIEKDQGAILPTSLDQARVKSIPPSIYYIPNFISEAEEALINDKIQSAPVNKWTNLSHRRLQSWPAKLTPTNVLLASALPAWLSEPIIPRLQSLHLAEGVDGKATNHVFSNSPHEGPNHVLINEYRAGQGIMPHEDGAAYFPVVSTVSLGGSIVLDIYGKTEEGQRESTPRFRILQEPRSLLITSDGMYRDFLHGVAEITVDEDLGPTTIANWNQLGAAELTHDGKLERVTRTSLTYRDVLKTKNIGKLFAHK